MAQLTGESLVAACEVAFSNLTRDWPGALAALLARLEYVCLLSKNEK